MNRIVACLIEQHLFLPVLAAAVICLGSAASVVSLLPRQAPSSRLMRFRAVVTPGLALGAGAWSTHFVAMLAYDPGLPVAYDVSTTVLSFVLAVAGTSASLLLWIGARDWVNKATGGALAGLAVAAMHYLGMSALRLPAQLHYHGLLVGASIIVSALGGALAFVVLHPDASRGRRAIGALLIVLFIVSLHFTGMGAVNILPDLTQAIPDQAMPRLWLASLVATVSFVAIVAALGAVALEARLGLAAQVSEASRLRGLADATFEALALCNADGRVTDANTRLVELVGRPRTSLLGMHLDDLFVENEIDNLLTRDGPGTATLVGGVPVETLARQIETGGGQRTVFALRDLRERVAAESRIRHLANHDPLTGLGNRALLGERLERAKARAQRSGEPFALLCLDLDRFKPVNDVHGHATGDHLLRQVAARLSSTVRDVDLVARVGGDEFVILQHASGQPNEARALAERLVERLAEPFDLDGTEVSISVSVGVALFPTDAAESDRLLRAADVALYRAKEIGRAGFAFFQADMDRNQRERRAMEQEIRLAAFRGQLSLAWQPQALAATGEVVGFEALLRWEHPTLGKVMPGLFIPVAEASGAIVQLGNWALLAACQEAASWSRPLRVAVNASPLQVQQADFARMIERVLADTGLTPHRLEIEVTESLLMTDAERALDTLRTIKAMGVRVSLDDFGTGYSSLGTLRTFPFDKIKVDRSFVATLTEDPQSAAIVSAILGLSRGMGLPVTAEGVETQGQLGALRTGACEEVQGYLIGRPLPISAYATLVGAHGSIAA